MMDTVRSRAERVVLAAQWLRKPLSQLRPMNGAAAPRPSDPAAGLPDAGGSLQILALGGIALLPPGKPTTGGSPRLFDSLSRLFGSADWCISNLESVLTTRTAAAGTIGSFLRADPEAVSALAVAGVDIVSCATNHCLDFGHEALAESVAFLA